MLKKTAISVMMLSVFGLTGCDVIKSMTQKAPTCNDTTVLETLEENLRKKILDATKAQLQFSQGNVDVGLIKEAVNHLKINLDDVQDGHKEKAKNLCQASLTIGLHQTLLERAEATRKAKGELPLQDFAFRQNIELIATQVQHELHYSTALDNEKVKVELEKADELQEFVAKIIVNASEQPNSAPKTSTITASTPVPVASVATPTVTPASAPVAKVVTPNTQNPTDKTIGPAGTAQKPVEKPVTKEIDSDAVGQAELAKIQREQAKAKAQLEFKRKEFNTLWNSASTEAQESLVDDQKQWVKDRDATCTAEAQEAEPAYQETERMRCQARLLGERYYEVKEYFANYE